MHDDYDPNHQGKPDESGRDDPEAARRRAERLDRLMGAKDRAEKESERWSEIEERGEPLPSRDQDLGMTQPVPREEPASPLEEPPVSPEDLDLTQGMAGRAEPPITPGDTPLSQDTPPRREIPAFSADHEQAPGPTEQEMPSDEEATIPLSDALSADSFPDAGEPQPPKHRPWWERQGLPPPEFVHPTDKPQSTGPRHPTDRDAEPPVPDLSTEPPIPDPFDQGTYQPAPPRRPQASHRRYEEPPADIEQPEIDDQGFPVPRRSPPHSNLDVTQPSPRLSRDSAPTQAHGTSRPELPADWESPPPPDPSSQPTMPSRAYITDQPAPPAPRPSLQRPVPQPVVRPQPESVPQRKTRRRRGMQFSWGCVGRAVGLLLIAGIVAMMFGGGGVAIYYSQVTAPSFKGINDVSDLQERALQFQTTRIYDNQGGLLYEINDPQGGFRDYVTLDEVSPWVIVATVATEERNYFTNPGFSIPGIVRAMVQNFQEGEIVSGASTITQQLTRALLLPETERTERSYERKIKEVFLSAELGRRFSKTEVLELYLNQIYYGNLAYGIEAAAQTYFNKSAADLTFAEASFLAGLPQAPAIYDPVTNRGDAVIRQQQVIGLMIEAGCIDTGNAQLDLPCTTQADIDAAEPELSAIAQRQFQFPAIQARYPHWIVYIQQLLEDLVGSASLYTSGYDVYTTLDPRLQDIAQEQVESTLAGLQDRNVGNASVIVVDVHTGAILAMVGSRDFDDESINGQVNVSLTPQQPGSSIKPFTYLAAFRQGWTPATVIWDVPIEYEIPGFGVYAPVNYSGTFNGPVTVRYAIANSLNVPAVSTLDHVGVPALLEVLNDLGIDSLGDPSNPYNYGLSLTLGAGEVYLLDWTNAYATIGNGGTYRPLYGIQRIERDGQVIEGYPYQVPPGEQVVDPGQAYLLQSILSDKQARIPSFGQNTPISPSYPAGAKTGTTNDFRDNWTMGFTTKIAVGVWVGNTDNSEMINVTGVTGAGPIWRGVMDGATQFPEYAPEEFPRPPGVFPEVVCDDDGALPSEYCKEHSFTHTELFTQQPPGPDQSIYKVAEVDVFTNLLANEYCSDHTTEFAFLDLPNESQLIDFRPFIRDWIINTEAGRSWAAQRELSLETIGQQPPTAECGPDVPRPNIALTSPQEGETIEPQVVVFGSADAPNFDHYRVEFGVSHDPIGWGVVQGDTSQPILNGVLGQVDLSAYGEGPMTIRLIVYDQEGQSAEVRVHVNLVQPTATPTPTASVTPTPSATPTATQASPTSTEEAPEP